MTVDLEQQLRSALTAKTNGITATMLRPTSQALDVHQDDDDVIRLEHGGGTARPRRWYVTGLVTVAAAAAALVVGVTVTHDRGQGVQTLGRDKIPWAQVGDGWTLVQSNPSYAERPGSDDLYLVEPSGRSRYLLEDLAGKKWQLTSWSPLNAKALFVQSAGAERTNVILLDPRTLAQTTISVPATYSLAQWTDQTHFVMSAGAAPLLFGSMAGGKATYAPANAPGAGTISGDGPVTLPGGFVGVGSDNGIVVFRSDGKLVRTVAAPAGFSGCSTYSAWSDGLVAALCSSAKGGPVGKTVLFPISGSSAQPIGPTSNPAWQLWKLGGGTYGYLDDAGPNGPGHFGRLESNGQVTELALPSRLSGTQFFVIGADRTRIYVRFDITAWQRQGVLAFDPATGEQTAFSELGQTGTSMPMIAPYGMLPELPR